MQPLQSWAQTPPREKVASIILTIGVIGPALIAAGFVDGANVLSNAGWAAVTALSGAVGGAMLARRGRWVAALLGMVAGPATLLAVDAYTQLWLGLGRGDAFYILEFMIPIALVLATACWIHVRIYPRGRPARRRG